MGKLCRPRQIIFVYTFAFADVSFNMCTTLRRFIRGRLVFFFEVAPGASPHIFVSKMMTSTQGLRKGKEKNAEPDPGTVVLSKLSMAASEARNATMASIAELVDDAAAKNGGRVPKGFIPKVIQQFSIVAPGLNRDKINYYRKEYEKKRKRGALHGGSDIVTPESSALAGLPQNDERGATNGSALVVVTPESLLASSLPQDDDAGPPRKRQKGGRPKGTTVKSSQAEYDIYQKVCAEAARDFQNALDEVAKTGKCRMKKGLLDQIIQDVKTRHNVEHFEIPLATIRKRISRKNLAPPPPMGTTPAPAASITFNSPVDDVSTITEITIQEASGRSEERVADCEQGMMQRIEM